MLDGTNLMIYGAVVSSISFLSILFMMPGWIKSLIAKGKVVPDVHKAKKPQVPRPAGPVIAVGIAAAESMLFVLTMNTAVLAILLTTTIAFFIGYIDDSRVMPGWFKPVALLAAAVPLVFLHIYVSQIYQNSLNLIFGSAYIPILHIPLIFVIIPITGNTINSIDVLNGVASGFLIIATVPLLASIAIFGSPEVFLASLPLLFSMIAFLFLASVKRIVEHRQVKARPTILTDDLKIAASTDSSAPATLVRLIVADRPLGEREVSYQI